MANEKSGILEDHLRDGKKFIPKMVNSENNLFIDWDRFTVPEIIWIALILDDLGDQIGTDFVIELAKIIDESVKEESIRSFLLLSNIDHFTESEKQVILKKWKESSLLKVMNRILGPFLNLYPNCPLSFILEGYPSAKPEQAYIERYKEVLDEMLDKNSRTSVMSVAAVIYNQFVLDKLKVPSSSSLAEFPEVSNYPNTDKSKMIASSIRALIKILYNNKYYNSSSSWKRNFWDFSYKIEPMII
ncbi:MAG: hypothetical protein HKN39_02460 [Flavobacteriales bacterium]|nr:hypothetical protein [Flavobacteriales bacterium]